MLTSIKTKTAFETRRKQGQTFGNPQNLTARGRKLGLATIKAKVENSSQSQKVLEIIEKCRMDGMGWGKIANALNQHGFRTRFGKSFYKMTVKRLYISDLNPLL